MTKWTLQARTRGGQYLATLPFFDLQGEFFMNKPKQIRWSLPLRHEVITMKSVFPGKTEVWLLRNDQKVFVGPLWNATASSKDNTLACDGQSVESYLSLRRINADVEKSGSRSDIAWSLINDTQSENSGDLGITAGTLSVTPSMTTKYARGEGIYVFDAIDEFASEADDGFDWEIDVDRVFNTYYPRIQSRARVRLEYLGNITQYSLQAMGMWEANDILIKGPDDSLSQVTVDTVKRAEYGLRQYTGSNTSAKTQTQLNNYAQDILNKRRDIRLVPQVSVRTDNINPFEGDITIGQLSHLYIDDSWAQFDQDMRMTGFQVTVGRHGEETFVLYLSDLREVDGE